MGISRRSLLKGLGGAAAIPFMSGVKLPSASASSGEVSPRIAWHPTSLEPAIETPLGEAINQRMHPTLMPAGRFLPDAIDLWYLWIWTHDTSTFFLYTAPNATGPYTLRHTIAAPTPFPAGYATNHLSAGDICWDSIEGRFIASPHGLRLGTVPGNAEPCQDSFLLESADGVTWDWLDGDNSPRLLCGSPGTYDSVHTGYGRLLRTLEGQLATFNNRYWWIYRGTRKDAPTVLPGSVTIFRPALASAPTLNSGWNKEGIAFHTEYGDMGAFAIGSFTCANGAHQVFMGLGSSSLVVPAIPFFNNTLAGGMQFNPLPVPIPVPEPSPGVVLAQGPNVVRDDATNEQFLAQTSNVPGERHQLWIYRPLY